MTIPLLTLLRDLLSDPAAREAYDADPAGWLASHGHDLPDELVGEAITQVAAGLPAAAAESIAPFVMADSPIPTDGVDGSGLDVLRSVDPVSLHEAPDGSEVSDDLGAAFGSGADEAPAPSSDTTAAASHDDGDDGNWGGGLESEASIDDPFAVLDAHESLSFDAEPVVDTDPVLDVDEDPASLDGLE